MQQPEDELDSVGEARAAFYATADLRAYWYPLAPLPIPKPIALHILGDPIVAYGDTVLADKCAHRSVPLSTGMYHGWQYNTDGKVIKLPSCLPDKSIPTCAKVRKYPTKVVEGWLWVHPGTPEQVQSAPEPVFCKPWGDETPNPTLIEYIDIEVDHCLLTDPSHVPFTHDGTIGKRENATAMKTTCTFHPTHITGNQITPVKPQRYSTEFVFYPPSTVGLKFKDEVTGQKFDQSFHSVPTKQGHSRWVYVFRMFSLKSVEWIPGALTLFKMVNRSFTRKILMQDYQMLKGQTDRLKVGANAMNCPVAADLLNKVYRNWWRLAIKKKPYFQGYSATGDLEDLCSE